MKKNTKVVLQNFKIEDDLKDRFAKVAKANDITPSQLLRGFVKDYISKNAQGNMLHEL